MDFEDPGDQSSWTYLVQRFMIWMTDHIVFCLWNYHHFRIVQQTYDVLIVLDKIWAG